MIAGLLLLVLGGVAYCVASEGAWGAGLVFLCVLFSALLSMNYFEPFARMLEGMVPAGFAWKCRVDFIALVGLFTALVFGLRLLTEQMAPVYMYVDGTLHELGRWAFGIATGYLVMAFFLTAVHTAPLPRAVTATSVTEFLGFQAEKGNFFGMAPDRQWLGFTQFVSKNGLKRSTRHTFDGPYYRVGEFEGRWPSFPIRYANRREQIHAGGGGAAKSGNTGGGLKRVGPTGGGGANF